MPQKVTADSPEIEFNWSLSLIKFSDSEIFRATAIEFDRKEKAYLQSMNTETKASRKYMKKH